MTNDEIVDGADPVKPLYKAYWRGLRNYYVFLSLLGIACWFYGVPHLQWNYSHVGQRDSQGFVRADQKLDAWYFSVTGWRHVQTGDYGLGGLPVVLFIPLYDCLENHVYFPPFES